MIDEIRTQLDDYEQKLTATAQWLTEYARRETDVNAPYSCAARALWAAVRNVRETRAELWRLT